MKWRVWRRRDEDRMSTAWLEEQSRKATRIEFEGVAIRWPIQKHVNDNPAWTTAAIKKRA